MTAHTEEPLAEAMAEAMELGSVHIAGPHSPGGDGQYSVRICTDYDGQRRWFSAGPHPTLIKAVLQATAAVHKHAAEQAA